jgi:pimeloyl-ACP methyl ester carboxylesterase
MKTVSVNGLRCAYLEWGDRARPLVLLVHGFPDTPRSWDAIGPALAAEGYWVVAPFLRGYAPSEAGPRDTTASDLAEDGVGYVTALGRERAHLVGHDWGAELAYGAVALAPQRFLSLTTVAIPHRAALRPTLAIAWGLRHFISLKLPGAVERFRADGFAMAETFMKRWSPTWRYTAEDLEPLHACLREPGTVRAALGYYRAASFRTPPALRAPVTVPTLCIAGESDPAVSPREFEATRAHFTAGFDVLAVPGGHFCHRESPMQVIAGLLAHFRTHDAG